MNTATHEYIRNYSPIHRLVRSKVFWILSMLLLFTYPIVRSVYRELPPDLPVYFRVPPFELTNEFGKPFGSKNLNGKVYMASFAFTSCPSICPALMEKMQLIQKRIRGLGTKAALVTFSVDPENDTPKILYKYARNLRSNPYVWSFITGPREKMRKLLVEGYKVPMGEAEPMTGKVDGEEVTMMDIAHSGKIVLVDKNGDVRGFYSTDDDGINKLMIDVGILINKG